MSVEFIRKEGEDEGKLYIACDAPKCAEADEFSGPHFKSAMEDAKFNGWMNQADKSGNWKNYCAACAAE